MEEHALLNPVVLCRLFHFVPLGTVRPVCRRWESVANVFMTDRVALTFETSTDVHKFIDVFPNPDFFYPFAKLMINLDIPEADIYQLLSALEYCTISSIDISTNDTAKIPSLLKCILTEMCPNLKKIILRTLYTSNSNNNNEEPISDRVIGENEVLPHLVQLKVIEDQPKTLDDEQQLLQIPNSYVVNIIQNLVRAARNLCEITLDCHLNPETHLCNLWNLRWLQHLSISVGLDNEDIRKMVDAKWSIKTAAITISPLATKKICELLLLSWSKSIERLKLSKVEDFLGWTNIPIPKEENLTDEEYETTYDTGSPCNITFPQMQKLKFLELSCWSFQSAFYLNSMPVLSTLVVPFHVMLFSECMNIYPNIRQLILLDANERDAQLFEHVIFSYPRVHHISFIRERFPRLKCLKINTVRMQDVALHCAVAIFGCMDILEELVIDAFSDEVMTGFHRRTLIEIRATDYNIVKTKLATGRLRRFETHIGNLQNLQRLYLPSIESVASIYYGLAELKNLRILSFAWDGHPNVLCNQALYYLCDQLKVLLELHVKFWAVFLKKRQPTSLTQTLFVTQYESAFEKLEKTLIKSTGYFLKNIFQGIQFIFTGRDN